MVRCVVLSGNKILKTGFSRKFENGPYGLFYFKSSNIHLFEARLSKIFCVYGPLHLINIFMLKCLQDFKEFHGQ